MVSLAASARKHHPERMDWDAAYRDADTPWDLGAPTPALRQIMDEGRLQAGARILVPGCGRGYDALLLAERGYAVTAVDLAEGALTALRQDLAAGELHMEVVAGDFFSVSLGTAFDAVWDYTFCCALPPARRPQWAKRMAQLLRPDGTLWHLVFPLSNADPNARTHPPYPLSRDTMKRLLGGHFTLEGDVAPAHSATGREGKETLMQWQRSILRRAEATHPS